ncbi:stAR-related lipid transfer protein 9 isoform X2 [Nannospalax galili]|uniref:stAR-related lipid transfer protein 9 isoform X2 n=1 Tax=Nannospalax galili TaxID=1026970 RepID=UPI00111C0243|nr:stAR-related lipid transfer protein 9 isoform X2 [Nannospalax galili]
MANVRVAMRVRPLSKREIKEGGRIIVEIDNKVAKIRNLKIDSQAESFGDSREKVVAFGFDYCYWSVNSEDPGYASQETVFQDLGTEVLSGAAKGYNICLFAYGQTGSGKTYTMLGTPASVGLTPRICEGLFIREEDCASLPSSCRIKVSFLEIYNERVRDLLKQSHQKKSYALRVREHPKMGPYVQGLSQHVVTNYQQVIKLLEEGIANRITAATHVHEASSRSHAIFTIHYTQAVLQNNLPSEIASKINLVDLAGSERADPSYCKDRIIEGANINKSLVTLGIVISTLAQNSRVFSSCQSLSSTASSGGDSGIPSTASGTSSGEGPSRRQSYIPYRDSVLTWLLKDSLGGNSKTIMVATVSPAHTSYSETMNTLRYASNAKNIMNKPRVNEDANVKLIRELREEIERLKAMLLSFELRNFSSLSDEKDENLKEIVLQNELKIDQLTKDWAQRWNDWQVLMEHYHVDINKRKAGVIIDSSLPHLMALEDDMLSTRVVLYHLKEGTTKIGRIDSDQEQDIVLQGQWIERDHCTITSTCGVVILRPTQGARCTVNGREVTASCRLTQGAVITLGKAQKFRFNHPAEAAVLRQQRQVGEAVGSSGSLEWLNLDGDVTASQLGLCPVLWKERKVPEEQSKKDHQPSGNGVISHRAQIEQQQCFVEELRHQILEGQIRAQNKLEFDQAHLSRQIKDNQQWLLREETWLSNLQEQQQEDDCGEEKELEAPVAPDAWLPTAFETIPSSLVRSQKRVEQLQLLRRHTLRAAEQNIWRKRVSFRLERIIKKQRLLEAHRRLEQLRAFYWLQDDSTLKSPSQVPSSIAPGSGPPQRRSRWRTCSPLSLQRLCSQHLPQLHSAFLNQDPSSMSPPVPDPTHQIPKETSSADSVPQAAAYPPRTGCLDRNSLYPLSWRKLYPARGVLAGKTVSTLGTSLLLSCKFVNNKEIESGGKQPCQMASEGLVTPCQSTKKLKPRDGSRTFIPTAQTKRAKGLSASGNTQAWWQKEGSHRTYKATKGASCYFTYSSGHKKTAGHGKAAKTFQAESKAPPPNRASKKHQRVLTARVRDIAKKFSHLPHGSPLKRYSIRDLDTIASLTDSSPTVDHARKKDNNLSAKTDSNYSVDSLSYVYAKGPKELLKSENLQGKWAPQEPENSKSDNSQISEDSLADKGHQSPKESSWGDHPTNDHGRPKTRTSAFVRGLSMPSNSGLHTQAHRSFSLDSLIDAEEELDEDQQEEPFLGSADEMPTETFWHLQNTTLPAMDQEATCRPGRINHRIGVRLNAFLPMSNSFYLGPQFQPCGKQPESEVEISYSERPSSLSQLTRESPLVSVDSWFSCDSKILPGSPPGIVDSSCPSPDVHEVQTCGEERPGYWLNIENVKPSGNVLPCSSNLPQGSAEPPCSSGDVYTTSVSKISKPSIWGTQRFLKPGAVGIFQGREIPNTAQQGISEGSGSVLAASATSFTHVGDIHGKDWAALQQKCLLELSHSVLEATGRPQSTFPFLEEDSSSLAEASDSVDTQVPVGPGVSSNFDISYFPVHLSKSRHLRAEKEQDNLSAKLESTSDFLSTSEKEVSFNGAYSADLESLTSGSINMQACMSGNKIPHSITEACEIKQDNLEECLQGSSNPRLMTSSKEYFFQKKVYHSVTIATKSDHWPQEQAPLRKNTAIQPGESGHNSRYSLHEGKATCQESSKEVARRHVDACFTFPSSPELDFHSASWIPFPQSLQPPPLETFYITQSRDALTETALEIPACREEWVPSPPHREAWGFAHNCQVFPKARLKDNFPVLSQSQNSKIASSQQVTTKRPTDLNTGVVTEELEKCPRNIKEEENHDSVYCFVAHNRYHFPSTSLKGHEFENQVGISNKKYNLPVQKEGEQATAQSHCNGAFDSCESEKTFLFICDSEACGEEQNVFLPQIKAYGIHSQISHGARSGFISKTTSLNGLEKDIPGEAAVSLKSRSVHHQVSSPVTMEADESPSHKWEEGNETGLLKEIVLSKDRPEEFNLPGTMSAYERFHPVTCSQERNPGVFKVHVWSQEMINSKEEPLGEKQNKRVNNAEEMARLIKSVMQLENDILEIESKQNKQLHTSHIPGVSKEFVFQDLQDQERADHVLMPGSSRNHLAFGDQPSFPRQMDDGIFSDSEAEEVEGNSTTSNDTEVKKIIQNPFRSRECAQNKPSMSKHSHPPGVHRPARGTCDSLGKQTALRESAKKFLHPRRMEALARALPLQPRVERTSEEDGELLKISANPKEQTWALESLEEPKTVKSFQESEIAENSSSSESEDAKPQGRVEETTVEREGNLQEEKSMVSSTQKLPSPSQHYKGTFFMQETVSPFLNQTGFSTAPHHQELSSSLPLHSPRPPRSSVSISDTKGMSSFEHMLDPTLLKTCKSPLATELGHQDQSRKTRSSNSHGNASEDTSMTHAAWYRSVIPMIVGSDGQSVTSGSILLKTEDWLTASTNPQDQRRDPRVTSISLTTQESLDSEAEATVQKEIRAGSLNRISRQTEKRVSFLLEDDDDQGEEARQKAEKEPEDQQPISSACLTPTSLPRVSDPEPRIPDSSVHASICLAILEEIRQAKAQRRQFCDFIPGGTALPYYETSLEHEYVSRAARGPQWQMDKLGSDSTRNEGETQGLHVASPSAVSAYILADKRKNQAIPLSASSFQPLPNPETDRKPQHHSLASSHTDPDLDQRPCTGEPSHFQGANGWSSSSEVVGKKKKTPRTLSSADPLASDRFLSLPTEEHDKRVGSKKVFTLSSQASCDDPGRILHGRGQLATWETVERTSDGQDNSPGHQEPKQLDSTYGGSSGNILVAAQEGKTVHSVCQSVIFNTDNSTSLSGPKQDHVQCSEASTGLEEGRASPKQCAIQPGALRKVELEAPAWQHIRWENVESGLAEACGTGNKNPIPTPLPDQRLSLYPSGVTEEAPGLCPKETLDCLDFLRSAEGSNPLSSSKREEENRTIPCPQLCDSQPTAINTCCSHSSTWPCYRDGVLRGGTFRAAPHSAYSPSVVPSRICEMNEIQESFSKESHVLFTHELEQKYITVELGPIDYSSLEPSAVAAVSSLAQGCCSSLSTSDVRANSISHSPGGRSSRSVAGSEKKTAEEKASTASEVVFSTSPTGMYCKSLRTLKGIPTGENGQASQNKPEPTVGTHGPQTLNLSGGSVEGELVVKAWYRHLENTITCLSEKTQPSTQAGDHSCLDPQAKFVARLKYTCHPQIGSLWEEEEQQRDQASGRPNECHAQGKNPLPSGVGSLDDCRIRDAEREEMAVTKSPISQTVLQGFEDPASLPLKQTEVPLPAAQRPAQLFSGREQLAPYHRCSLPVIAIFSGSKHARSSPRPQFSAISSSRSLQELNLSVQPPPTDEDAQWPNRLWSPCLRGHHSSEKSVARISSKTEDCSQKDSSNLDNSPANQRLLKPVTPPYPTSSTVSCMPIPDFMTNWMPGTLEQAHQGNTEKLSVQGRPGNQHSQVDKGMLQVGSSDINPCILPWCPQGPMHIGWKQYVFGSAVDVTCSQEPHGLTQYSSMNNGLEDKKFPPHPHHSIYTQTQDLSSIHNSIENAQSSNEGREVWSSSFASGNPHVLTGPEGVDPISDPDKSLPLKDPSDEASCLRSELPLAGGSSAALVDEIVLLYPSETGCPVRQARMNTFEQGTQTLGSRLHWSCTNISVQTDANAMSASELASWTSMHNLSLHLSQLLHRTSELLGSLSQLNVTQKDQNTKSDSPDEAPQVLMMDGATQTTMDEGIQTDLALPPLSLQAPEVNVIFEVLDSGIMTIAQEIVDVPREIFPKREAEKTVEPPNLREESTHCKQQSPPIRSSHLRFQKTPLGQNLPSLSLLASPSASLPPSSQPEESCVMVNGPSIPHSPEPSFSASEFTQEPSVQKKLGPASALLVDRASSPVLTFSPSTQELSNPLTCLTLSPPLAYPLEGYQKLDIYPDLTVDNPRPPVANFQATDESDGSQKAKSLGREDKIPLERISEELFLDLSSPCSPHQSSGLQVSFLGQPPQQLLPKSTTGDHGRLRPPPLSHRSLRLNDSFVPEKVASLEHPVSSRGPSQWQGRPASGTESSAFLVEPQSTLDLSSLWSDLQPLSPCPVSVVTDTTGLQGSALDPPQACQPVGLLCPSSHVCVVPDSQCHSMRHFPVHNQFNNWRGVQDRSCGGLQISEELGDSSDSSSVDQTQRPPQPSDNHSWDPEWFQMKQIPLQVGVQNPSLSMELSEAKLHRGFGETDALLQVLQSGTGEVLAPEEPAVSTWQELHARQKKAIETLRREHAERFQNFHWTRSISPQKQVGLLSNKDLPSKRREYLQQLRKEVVETTRSPEPASRSAYLSSDIELMLRDYERAREEAKVEISQAQDRLRKQTEQEKLRIHQQIISQLLREEEKLQTLANSSSLCTSSNGSLSSGVTSGYNSSPAFSAHLQSSEGVEDSHVPDSRDTWIGDWRARSTVRNSQLYLTGSTWRSLAYSNGCLFR